MFLKAVLGYFVNLIAHSGRKFTAPLNLKWSYAHGTTELCNSTKKRQHYFDILKALFVRHSSEYKTSDRDRKVNRNIYSGAVTRDRMRPIDPKIG